MRRGAELWVPLVLVGLVMAGGVVWQWQEPKWAARVDARAAAEAQY